MGGCSAGNIFNAGVIVYDAQAIRISYKNSSDQFYNEFLDGKKKLQFLSMLKISKEFMISVEYGTVVLSFTFGHGDGNIRIEKPRQAQPNRNSNLKIEKILSEPCDEMDEFIFELSQKYDCSTDHGLSQMAQEFFEYVDRTMPVVIPKAEKVANYKSIFKIAKDLRQYVPFFELDKYEPDNHGCEGAVGLGLDIEQLCKKHVLACFSYKSKDTLEKLIATCSALDFEFSPGLGVLTMNFYS